jgi:nucleoid-associated protein YgaU
MTAMGLLDFFKKGEEKKNVPKQNNPVTPINQNQNPQMGNSPTGAAGQNAKENVYIVKAGDSLSKIAKHLWGDAQQWNRLYEANKDQIRDPNLIHPGQKLIIPG